MATRIDHRLLPPSLRPNYAIAKGRTSKPGEMNSWEKAYSDHLGVLLTAGEIAFYQFEGVKLRLAKKTTYTADFVVVRSDGVVELYEVKGFWRDDARVKIKVAAEMYWPFQFVAVQGKRKGGNWVWTEERF